MSRKTNIRAHIILVTKYRKKILVDDLLMNVIRIITEETTKRKMEVIAINGENDHIHIMLKLLPTQTISLIVKLIKQLTTYHIWRKYPTLREHYWYKNVLWSNGYFCSTTGDASSETVKKYIESQGN